MSFTGTVFGIATCHEMYPERKATFDAIRNELRGFMVEVYEDKVGLGKFWPFWNTLQQALRRAKHEKASHVTLLPDDCTFNKFSVDNMFKATKGRTDDVLDMMVNHAAFTGSVPPDMFSWYTTPDGFIGMGGTARVETWEQIAAFRDEAVVDGCTVAPFGEIAFDELVNLFCMYGEDRRDVWHTAQSILGHDSSLPSRCGNDWQEGMPGRHGTELLVGDFDPSKDWLGPSRTYKFNHWRLFHYLKHDYARKNRSAERMYEIERIPGSFAAK